MRPATFQPGRSQNNWSNWKLDLPAGTSRNSAPGVPAPKRRHRHLPQPPKGTRSCPARQVPAQGGRLSQGIVHGKVTCLLHGWNIGLDDGQAWPDVGSCATFKVKRRPSEPLIRTGHARRPGLTTGARAGTSTMKGKSWPTSALTEFVTKMIDAGEPKIFMSTMTIP